MRFPAASGIAIAPILFVVALLAILATAISAATSSFSGGTDSEKARAMAEVVLSSCQQYKTALARMLANGCAIEKIDWRPDVPLPAAVSYTAGDFTSGNGTNKDGNGKCAMHHILGGGMQWRQLPREALADTLTGAYSEQLSGSGPTYQDGLAGYPILYGWTKCIHNVGTCQSSDNYSHNAVIMLSYHYLRANLCTNINKLLKFSWADISTYVGAAYWVGQSFIASTGNNVKSIGDAVYRVYMMTPINISDLEACGYSYYSNSQNSDYQYLCALMVR